MKKETLTSLQKLLEILQLACEAAASELFFDEAKIRGFANSSLVFQIDNPNFEGFFRASFNLPQKFVSQNRVYLLRSSPFYSHKPLSLKISLLPETPQAEVLPWFLYYLENYLSALRPLNFVISHDSLARHLFLQEISERLPKFKRVPFWSDLELSELLNSEIVKEAVYFLGSGSWQTDLELLPVVRHLKIPTFLEGKEFKKSQKIDTIFRVKRVRRLCSHCKQPEPLPSQKLLKLVQKLPKESLKKYISRPALLQKQGCPKCRFQGYHQELLVWESSFTPLSLEETLTLLALAGEISQEEVFAS